eukprot:COSAG02_NODE_904_length_16045_cov_3920.854697_3_plen_79_part_00
MHRLCAAYCIPEGSTGYDGSELYSEYRSTQVLTTRAFGAPAARVIDDSTRVEGLKREKKSDMLCMRMEVTPVVGKCSV